MLGQRNIEQSKPSEVFNIEDIYRLALYASQNQGVVLELWDKNGKTIPFSAGSNVPAAALTVTSTASSWPVLAVAAGYTTNAILGIPTALSNGDTPSSGTGAQPYAVGGCLRVPSNAAVSVYFNFGGTHDGSGTNGIASGSAGPSANSPGVLNAGDVLLFGLHWENMR